MWSGNTTGTSLYYNPAPVDDSPILTGSGPAECSSCTQLSVVPLNIFDVNGYYRELGVDPRASRKQLRLAYQAKDGQSSARLTYILKQLLDPAIRFAYDCTLIGEVFMDRYVHEMLKQKIKTETSNRMRNLYDVGVDLANVDMEMLEEEVTKEMGWNSVDVEDEDFDPLDADTPDQTVDSDSAEGQDDASPAKFEYSYYLWKSRSGQDLRPTDLMVKWQRFLVSALAREGVTLKFAVGLHGDRQYRWVQGLVGYRTVFFLSVREEPTEELAGEVARQYRLDREKKKAAPKPRNHREIEL